MENVVPEHEETPPADVMAPSLATSDPLASIRKTLWEGFCGPPRSSVVVPSLLEEQTTQSEATTISANRSISSASSAGTDTPCVSSRSIVRERESSVIVDDDLKQTLEGFYDRDSPTSEACDHSLAITRSYDSDEHTHKSNEEEQASVKKEAKAVEAEDDEGLVVVLTRSGTNRIVRVFRGLETFFYALLLVFLTLWLLRLLEGNSLGLEIRSDAASQGSPIFSIIKAEEVPREPQPPVELEELDATSPPVCTVSLFPPVDDGSDLDPCASEEVTV